MTTAILRAPILLFFAANLASCVPAPHTEYLRPTVSGTILEDRKPIPDVTLFLGKFPGNNQPCTDVGEVIPVSAQGNFSWESVQERRLADSLINSAEVSGTLTVLCIRHPTKGVLIGSMMFMMKKSPVSLRLICDVAHPHSVDGGPPTSTMLGQSQYCETSRTD
jgi:hypothetical protein